jgi:glycerophosphoryl diester phosphodiesterase
MDNNILTAKPFAHRGLHGAGVIENSIAAFKTALQKGFAFELDILLSKDGKAMVFHDVSLKRLTGHKGNIDHFTQNELQRIKLRGQNNGTISSLSDVLELTANQCLILIEIKGDQGKYDEIAQAVYDALKNYQGPYAIMSFYPEIISWFKDNAPDILRGLVATPHNDDEFKPEYYSPEHQIQTLKRLECNFLAYDISAIPNEATNYCNDTGLPLLTWTVRGKRQQARAAKYAENIIFEEK